ncbi:MAG TPA: hypothetical protein VIV15_00240 [Anaerolineales bacterium]
MMPNDPRPMLEPRQPIVYQIRIKDHLDDRWIDGFEKLTVAREETGDTLLMVPVVDQAALYGLLRKLRDLGVRLISINPAEPAQPGNLSQEEKSP